MGFFNALKSLGSSKDKKEAVKKQKEVDESEQKEVEVSWEGSILDAYIDGQKVFFQFNLQNKIYFPLSALVWVTSSEL